MKADVLAVGARGPLGLGAQQVALCARARKYEPRSLPHLHDKRDREIGMCLCGGLPLELSGFHRLLSLAAPAAREALHDTLPLLSETGPIPTFVALPERGRPDDDERFAQFVSALGERSALPLEPSAPIRSGHAGFAFALEAALAKLEAGAPVALAGAVDSYYHPALLRWLDAECRLHALDAEDGFTPSEAAAFALLARPGALARRPIARLAQVATALEPASLDGGRGIGAPARETEPNVGEAMTELIEALEGPGRHGWVLHDVNGERHRVREWTLCKVRHQLGGDVAVDALAVELGDVGAASGALYLAIACGYWRLGCAPAERALVLLHSEGPERGGFSLEAAP